MGFLQTPTQQAVHRSLFFGLRTNDYQEGICQQAR